MFKPTHFVPDGGMPSWDSPDPARPSSLVPQWVEVEVPEQRGDWSRIVCANGWAAWVDGRRLLELDVEPLDATVGAPASNAPAGGIAMPQGRALVAAAGAAAAAVATFLPWLSLGGLSANAYDVPFAGLFSATASAGGLSAGVVILLIAIAGLLAVVWPQAKAARRPAGAVVAGLAALFVVQIGRQVKGSGVGLADAVGIGTYLTVLGGVVLFAGESAAARARVLRASAPAGAGAAPSVPAVAVPALPDWATHAAPITGMKFWEAPDPSRPATGRLDPLLPVRALERRGEWAFVECSNGFRAWVDARRLQGRTS